MSRFFWLPVVLFLAVMTTNPNILYKVLTYSGDLYIGVVRAFLPDKENEHNFPKVALFSGDIMLGRHVETLMRRNGSSYPYQQLESFSNAVWIGNFEAVVADNHVQTPDFTYALSVDKTFLSSLHDYGFRYLNLANNHTLDFGSEAFNESKINLSNSFSIFGDPDQISENSTTYIELSEGTIGLLGINATYNEPDFKNVFMVMAELQKNSDIQIAYIHWGDEYELTHNTAQEKIAEKLIDGGFDAVIGHHPHVVQDVALYQEKPIFYSLGNFIFDQYFNEAVQEGLAIKLSFEDSGIEYELLPITSREMTAAPRFMLNEEKDAFLIGLAERSNQSISSEISSGSLLVK